MANEISLTVQLGVSNANFKPPAWSESLTPNQATAGAAGGVMATSTTPANVPLGTLTSAQQGYAMFKNIDLAANIDLGIVVGGVFQAFAQLQPNEACVLRLYPGVTLQAKAESGTPGLQNWILQI